MLNILKRKKQADPFPDITDKTFKQYYDICSEYTMTSVERMYALYNATKYVIENNIPGDFVECGVWKGGSSLLIALILKENSISNRKIYLYDTFEGMSEPTTNDVDFTGATAEKQLSDSDIENQSSVWCYSGMDEVKKNFTDHQIDLKNIEFVKGKVEETIPQTIPSAIALLRLDTDWYESTKHEMDHLYPLLENKGVLIIDDYGHWKGCRKAIDEYFESKQIKPLINRIDYTGRLIIKT
ncbi:MAG: TylF/MycF/NovP-related O-methyltransferase [Crocinitomicaceae bacterium]|nr:class I SAM-dependent methyltransferase [Crocinitomicaceae bacterium]